MPRTNLRNGAARTLARGAAAREKMELRVSTAALVTAETVVADTPVQTALARSNWQGTLSSPANASLAQAYVPYPPVVDARKKLETTNRGAAMRQIVSVWSRHQLGVPLFLTNNVDYLAKLNAGHSVQTRAGFLERASARGRAVSRRIV